MRSAPGGRDRASQLLRQLTHPLSAALVVAALGLTTAFVVLALRDNLSAPPPPPVALATPAPSASASSGALPSGTQTAAGRLAGTAVIALSSDTIDEVTIDAGTQVQATFAQSDGRLVVLSLVAGAPPAAGPPGGGDKHNAIAGSTATATTITLDTAAGELPLTIPQDSQLDGRNDPFGVQITGHLP